MSLPPRAEIDPTHRFDLTRIYDDPEAWDAAHEAFHEDLATLEELATERPSSPDDLRALLDATESCHDRRCSLALYATLYRNVNTDEEVADDLQRADRDLSAAFEPVVAAVRRRLAALDAATLDEWLAELDGGDADEAPRDGYRHYAENLRTRGAYTCEPAVEEAVAAFEEPRTAPVRTVRAVTNGDFDPEPVERPASDDAGESGTETVTLRFGNYQTELSHPDRAYRRRVYESYRTEMDRFETVLTRAVAEKLNAAAAEAELRGYDSIRDRALSEASYPETGVVSGLPESVHDTLLEAVREELGPYERARRLRRERLGVETLRPWDTRVPLVDADPEIDYEDARRHILAALEPLGADYVARARRFFEERRIDVFPTQSKRTDIPAYCPSSPSDGAFVLANFREDVRTTFFVAHELGHAINVAYHSEGPTRYANSRTPVCEVPSILHELLLADHLIDGGGPLADAARNRRVELVGGNLYRNARTTAFGHELATLVEDGDELTPERARGAHRSVLADYEPLVEYPEEREGRDWLGRGTRPVYTGFQYVLGAVGALATHEALERGELTPTSYHEFLRDTGRLDAVSSFETLGVDVTTREPYRRAAARFDDHVDELATATELGSE